MSNETDHTIALLTEDRAKLREIAEQIRSTGTHFALDEFFSKADVRWELIHDPILRFAELAYRNAEMLSNEYHSMIPHFPFAKDSAVDDNPTERTKSLEEMDEWANTYHALFDRVCVFLANPSAEAALAVVHAGDEVLKRTHLVVGNARDWYIAKHQSAWNLSDVSTAASTKRRTNDDD